MTESLVVFGASGFVGQNFVRRMAGRVGRLVAVVGASGPVRGADQTVRIGELERIGELPPDTVVVHLAAQRYDAARFEMAQSDLVTANSELANKVFRFCLDRGLKEVRMASSVAVYPAGLPVMDDAVPVDLNAPPNPNEAFYAWSKRWAEIMARLHRDRFGINTLSFRLSNPYGPHDSTDPGAAHVLPAFVMRALGGEPTFKIRGNPLVERDFIFVDDVTDVFERSLDLRGVSDELNLCRGETDTLLALAETAIAISGRQRPIEAGETVTHGVLARRSTNARLREMFGKTRFATLAEGLKPTMDWYRHAGG